jgi:hypothetical protein
VTKEDLRRLTVYGIKFNGGRPDIFALGTLGEEVLSALDGLYVKAADLCVFLEKEVQCRYCGYVGGAHLCEPPPPSYRVDVKDGLVPDDMVIIAGMVNRSSARELAEGCGCTFDHRLPDDAPPVLECDYHREQRDALVRYLKMEIRSYWALADAASRLAKLSTLGDTCSGLHGRAEGLHQVLFRIDPEAARTLASETLK